MCLAKGGLKLFEIDISISIAVILCLGVAFVNPLRYRGRKTSMCTGRVGPPPQDESNREEGSKQVRAFDMRETQRFNGCLQCTYYEEQTIGKRYRNLVHYRPWSGANKGHHNFPPSN